MDKTFYLSILSDAHRINRHSSQSVEKKQSSNFLFLSHFIWLSEPVPINDMDIELWQDRKKQCQEVKVRKSRKCAFLEEATESWKEDERKYFAQNYVFWWKVKIRKISITKAAVSFKEYLIKLKD